MLLPKEIKEFAFQRTEPANCDANSFYVYWNDHSRRLPRLENRARDILAIQATSTASERALSAVKELFGLARISLRPDTAEALICLRSWYKAGLVGKKDVVFLEENLDPSQLQEEDDEDYD